MQNYVVLKHRGRSTVEQFTTKRKLIVKLYKLQYCKLANCRICNVVKLGVGVYAIYTVIYLRLFKLLGRKTICLSEGIYLKKVGWNIRVERVFHLRLGNGNG